MSYDNQSILLDNKVFVPQNLVGQALNRSIVYDQLNNSMVGNEINNSMRNSFTENKANMRDSFYNECTNTNMQNQHKNKKVAGGIGSQRKVSFEPCNNMTDSYI